METAETENIIANSTNISDWAQPTVDEQPGYAIESSHPKQTVEAIIENRTPTDLNVQYTISETKETTTDDEDDPLKTEKNELLKTLNDENCNKEPERKENGKLPNVIGNISPPEEERNYAGNNVTMDDGCCVTCLYYSVNCCECSIM